MNLMVSSLKADTEIHESAVRDQLLRVLDSPIFVHSQRLSRFLRFTVETALAGQADSLKEYLIGTEVYDRKPPYHPSADSIVRSEARRLRNKLKQYYESVGCNDPVFIYYRPGGYAPVFRRRSPDQNPAETDTARVLSNILSESLTARDINFSTKAQELDIRIVFEGTLRISHHESKSCELTGLRLIQESGKRNQGRRVV